MSNSSFEIILYNISLIEKNRKWYYLFFILGAIVVFDPNDLLEPISTTTLFIIFTIIAYFFLKVAHFSDRLEAINKTLLTEIFVNANLMTEYPSDDVNKKYNVLLTLISMGNISCDNFYYFLKGYAFGRENPAKLEDLSIDMTDYIDLSDNKKLNNYRENNILLIGKLIQNPIINDKYINSDWNKKDETPSKPFYQHYINILLYSSIVYTVVILTTLFSPSIDFLGIISNDIKMLFQAVNNGVNTSYTVYDVTLLALLTKLRIWADISNIIIIIYSGCTAISQITETQAIKKTSSNKDYITDTTFIRLKHDYSLHVMIFIGTCIVFQYFPIT